MLRLLPNQLTITLHPEHIDITAESGLPFNKSVNHQLLPVISNNTQPKWLNAVHVLEEFSASYAGKANVKIIISNHFVRYLLIPWSPSLITNTEKLTVSRIFFEKVYGKISASWSILITHYAYGLPALASAIDQEMIDAIDRIFNNGRFKLVSLQPLIMSVVSQSTVEENKNVHYLIAEPGCITTIIVKEKAIVEVKVNLVGSAISLELLRILSRENATRPTDEAFKPYLLGVGLNISTLSEEVIGRCLTQPKAVSRNFNSIKNFPLQIGIFSTAKLRLDYARQGQVKRLVNNSSLIILIIMSAYLAFTYLNLTDKIKLIESATASKHHHKSTNTTLLKNRTSIDVATLQEMKEAKSVIAELGIPWNKIFTEIEALSQENISLLQLQTDINNSTITITGEAKDLTAITNYIKALAESKFFSDVHLLSHQVKSIDIQNSSAFTIKAVWDHKNQQKLTANY